jgi:hypothetical protein
MTDTFGLKKWLLSVVLPPVQDPRGRTQLLRVAPLSSFSLSVSVPFTISFPLISFFHLLSHSLSQTSISLFFFLSISFSLSLSLSLYLFLSFSLSLSLYSFSLYCLLILSPYTVSLYCLPIQSPYTVSLYCLPISRSQCPPHNDFFFKLLKE